MAIAFRASAQSTTDSASTLSFTDPGTAGDYELLFVEADISGGGGWTAPTGWTNLFPNDQLTSVDGATIGVFFLASAVGGGATVSITIPSGPFIHACGALLAWSGADSAVTPVSAHQLADSAHTDPWGVTCPSVTANAAGGYWVAAAVLDPNTSLGTNIFVGPSVGSFTDRLDVTDSSNWNAMSVAYGSPVTGSASSGTTVITLTRGGSASAAYVGYSILLTPASSGSPALTGVAGTGAVGTVAKSVSKGVTGNAGTAGTGTVTPSASHPITGSGATGSAGTVAPSVTKALTGVVGTGAVGTVTGGQPATGVAGTGAAGTVAPSVAKAITGTAGTTGVGTVTPSASLATTGVAATGSTGNVASAAAVAITGTSSASAVGSVTPSVTIALTGVSGTGVVGSVTAPSTGGSAVTGVAAAGAAGTVAPAVTTATTGSAATAAAGTLAPGTTASLTGVAGTGGVGSVRAVPGLSGAQATGGAGTVAPGATKGITGTAGTGGIGSVTPAASRALSGSSGTGAAGSLVGVNVTIAITGVGGIGRVGSVSNFSPFTGQPPFVARPIDNNYPSAVLDLSTYPLEVIGMKPRKVGDTAYPIAVQLTGAGLPIALTGATVTFSMRSAETGIKVSGGACTITDSANGLVNYQPSAADVDTSGDFQCEFRVTTAGGAKVHFPTGFETLTLLESIT